MCFWNAPLVTKVGLSCYLVLLKWEQNHVTRQARLRDLTHIWNQAPSHYLRHCWLTICYIQWHSSQGIILKRSEAINQNSKIENFYFFFKTNPDLTGINGFINLTHVCQILWWHIRADYRFAPSQWETVLPCNNGSHWLGASLESALHMMSAGHKEFKKKGNLKFVYMCYDSIPFL